MKSNLVIREPKQQLPEIVAKLLVEKFPTAFGYSVPYQGTVLSESHPGDTVEIEATLKNVEETYKDDRVYYHFVQASENEINLESLQPFLLLADTSEGEDSKVYLSVLVDAELPTYQDKNGEGETYTPEYHFTVTFLAPLIQELWELANQDVNMLMTFLGKQVQQDKITAELGAKGAVLFIPSTGKSKLIATTNVAVDTNDWGCMTDNMGINKATTTPTTAKPSAIKKVLGLPTKPKEAPAIPEKKEEGSEKSPEEIYKEVLKRKEFFLSSGLLWAKPAIGDMKTARNWWSVNVGTIPKDPRLIYAGCATSELSANSPLRKFMMEKLEPKRADTEQGPSEPPAKITETTPPKEMGGITLFIPKDQKESYLKGKTENKYPTATIEELEATLAAYPAASVQLGEQFLDMSMMSPQAFLRLPTHIKLAVWHEVRCQLLGLTAAPPAQEEAPAVEPPKKKIIGAR